MADMLDTLVRLGLGTVTLTKERAKKIVGELAEQGEISKGEAQKLIKGLVKKGAETEKKLHRELSQSIEKVMKKLDIPTRKEVKELKAEIARLKAGCKKSHRK